LRIDINSLFATGRSEKRIAGDLSEVDAWVWPRSSMEAVEGPPISVAIGEAPVFPDEGESPPVPIGVMAPIERNTRRMQQVNSVEEKETFSGSEAGTRLQRVMEEENGAGLRILCDSIGLHTVPKYSVLRIGDKNIDVSEVLGLLHYGIRLILITPTKESDFSPEDLQAFSDSRLVEWAAVPMSKGIDLWIVDGVGFDNVSHPVSSVIHAAEASGSINFKQYAIVHASPGADIVVHAGAGTGKTETMSERVVFLLSTSETKDAPGGTTVPYDLRLDDIVLVTFTKEAARQMRERLAKTLNLRKRLSRRCVIPAVAWMMQLSTTEISTIHSYAKSLARQGAGVLGLSPEFRVSKQTMRFREELFNALSGPLDALFKNPKVPEVPAVHEWKELIEAIWEKLDNNGVELMSLTKGKRASIDWPHPDARVPEGQISRAVVHVLEELGIRFAEVCIENQAIPTSKLVTTALASLTAQPDPPVRMPRYVFVDEFQDTDTEQMELMVKLREILGANLFVVGDVKQGIYRFRGAEGSAFAEISRRLVEKGLPAPLRFPLTRNFRSGKQLLDSLHPFFGSWGKAGLLDYGANDQLEADVAKTARGSSFRPVVVTQRDYKQRAVGQVRSWMAQANKSNMPVEIAVLCRNNWTAMEIQRELVGASIPCELVVGGDFYRCPAVRELRVLLEALMNPKDNSAILELCETRWAEGIMVSVAPEGTVQADLPVWKAPVGPVISWTERFSTLKDGRFYFDDLEPLRARVSSLRNLIEKMPLLSLIMLCSQHFAPSNCALPQGNDESERRRYLRCFDHLLMQMDQEFSDTLMTLPQILSWLRIQIATNFSEDEPFEARDLIGKVTALTVHKSKGLEFDRVLLPYTWEPFIKERSSIEVVIGRTSSGLPRVIWKWKPKVGEIWSSPKSDVAWRTEQKQIQMEEARLLYVSMTRAREELVMYVRTDQSTHAPEHIESASWGDLISKVAGL
jgi:superfamily I DNA/RNA helicase